jgi:two-component system, cell cycle response regulator DivK
MASWLTTSRSVGNDRKATMKLSRTHPGKLRLAKHNIVRRNGKKVAATLTGPGQRGEAPRRALVVESDPGTREICQRAVATCGLVADVVDNGVAAVSNARQNRPDLIIMDLQLRDSPGPEVIQWLRSNLTLKSTPAILLTTNAGDISRSKAWGVNAILLKPLTLAAIQNTIRDLLAAPASEQAN